MVQTAIVLIDLLPFLLFALTWLGIAAFLRLKKKQSFVSLLFFAIFSIYLYKVLDYTLFQFQSLLLLKYFMPDLMLNGQAESMNLIPLATLTSADVKTSLLNIVLMIPFGFGLPFVASFRMKKAAMIGALFSVGIELLQFVTGLMAKTTFRIADVNDVIFNTLGVVIGYILFIGFMHICRRLFSNQTIAANSIVRYIAERPQVDR